MRGTAPLILTLALFSCGSPAPEPAGEDPVTAPDAEVEITEWAVPWEDTTPRDPYVGPQNHVWFVGQGGDYIASFDPTTADFTHFDLDPGTGPHNLIVDDDGSVWYAGNRAAHIGKLDPESGEITKFPMPDPAAGDPHTLVFDQNGDIWFTVQAGNFVGKLWPRSGEIQLIPVPTEGARPYGIVIDSNNRPWIVEFGVNKIATVDPDTMTLEEITLPRPETRPRRLAVTSDDKIWYVDYGQGFLGRLDGVTHEIEEWPVPAGSGALAYAMAVDDRDRLWFVGERPRSQIDWLDSTRLHRSSSASPRLKAVVGRYVTCTSMNVVGRSGLGQTPTTSAEPGSRNGQLNRRTLPLGDCLLGRPGALEPLRVRRTSRG